MNDTQRVRETKCLGCGHRLTAIGGIIDDRGPQPGDPIACIRCGAVMTFEHGTIRGFTEAEMNELVADREAMDDLAKMVRNIHLLRHSMS